MLTYLLAFLIAGCAGTAFSPDPVDAGTDLPGSLSHTVDDVTVSVAILTDEMAQKHFGVDLGARGVQVLHLSVRNATPEKWWFVRNLVDPDFFSADETALLVRKQVADKDYEQLRQFLRDESIRILMLPMTLTEGYLFLPREEGGRYVDIRLARDAFDSSLGAVPGAADANADQQDDFDELRFGFALTLPDGLFDYERLDTEKTYQAMDLPDVSLDELRLRLEQLPCCARDEDNENNGDPLNVVLVGDANDVLNGLSQSGWSFTHRITPASVGRMVKAALDGEGYAVAPVSSLYLFDRPQDFALQRARVSLAQRNHTRFWLAPFTHLGRQVWVGQVSRDIGIKLTTKSPSLTTHIIDPEVDLTREYLFHSLLAQGLVEQFGFVKGSVIADAEDPGYNLAGDPFFSDGMRVIIMLSPHPRPYHEVENLRWERSSAPMVEGQTEAAERYVRPLVEEIP